MSILYFLIIREVGYFRIGRFIDLVQSDCVVVLLALILVYEVKRWGRIKDK